MNYTSNSIILDARLTMDLKSHKNMINHQVTQFICLEMFMQFKSSTL